MTAGSHFDAMVAHDMVAVFVLLTIPIDIFVFYYVHRISLTKPYYKKCNFLFKPIYPDYYTNLSHRNSNVSTINEDEDENNNKMFSENYGKICSEFLNRKHSIIEYLIIGLQCWSFSCGFLAFYASFIFWMNLLLQFFIISTGSDCIFGIIALSALYFIIDIIFWFIRRQFESLILITRNNGDIFDLGLLPIVRIYNLLLCFFCTLWTQFNSDNIGWKYFVLFMLIRGLYHQMIYVTICFFSSVGIVLSSMKKCKHFWKLICVVSTAIVDDEHNLNCCLRSKTKLFYIIFLWILIIIYSFLMTVTQCTHLFKVCIIMILLYYILIMFERGKYNAHYLLWRDKFSKQFLNVLPATKSRIDTVDDINLMLKSKGIDPKRRSTATPSLQIIQMQPSQSGDTVAIKNKMNKSRSKTKSKSTEFSPINDESDQSDNNNNNNNIDIDDDDDDDTLNEDGAGSNKPYNSYLRASMVDIDGDKENENKMNINSVSNESIAPTVIGFRQYWDRVSFSDERRCKCCTLCTGHCNQLCFKDYCKNCCCSKDGAKWTFCILLFWLFLFGTTGIAHRWLLFEEQSFDMNLDITSKTSYPVCNIQYNQYLNVMDLIYLSIAAHHETVDDIKNDFNIWFGPNYENNGWLIDNMDENHDPFFFHIYNHEYDIDIISIRTEPNPATLLPDIGQWSEISMFQIFSWFIPLTSILPKAFIRQYIEFVSIFENIIAPNIGYSFDEPIYNYCKTHINSSNFKKTNNSILLLIGHSLGGSIAQIVGARLYDDGYGDNNGQIISFGFNSIGTVYSSGKFGFSVESLDKSAISVLSRRDVIATIDDHGGFVQKIECTAQNDEECHGSVTTFCELYDECNNELIRNMSFVQCVCHDKQKWDDCR